MGVSKIFYGYYYDNFDYMLINWNKYCDIFNIGFWSFVDIEGNYLLKGVDDCDKK